VGEERESLSIENGEGERDDDDEDARSVLTIVPHELETVEEEEEQHIEGIDQNHQPDMMEEEVGDNEGEQRRRQVELACSRTPEPIGLGMTHNLLRIEDDEDLPPHSHRQKQPSLPIPISVPAPTAAPTPTLAASTSVIDTPLERLTTFSDQLEFTVELSSSLQAQHVALQSMILVLEEIVVGSP
jgi:hypothetical protein